MHFGLILISCPGDTVSVWKPSHARGCWELGAYSPQTWVLKEVK